MIAASETVKNILKQNSSITIDSGCTIEYNMNDLVNNINVKIKNISTGAELAESEIYSDLEYKSFKNIFPYKSIVLVDRPEYGGIRYGIFGDIGDQTYTNPKSLKYQKSAIDIAYRTYYPGVNNDYKYFITQKGAGARIAAEYEKTIFTNKIVIKFETSHSIPQSGNIKTTTVAPNGSYTQIATFTSSNINNKGVMTLYYTGSSWSFTESSFNMSSVASIKGLELQVSGISNKYIGIIELSPRWVQDISSDIVSIDISKESSMDQEISPVGIISANSLSMLINRFDNSQLKILTYDKQYIPFANDKLYLYKNVELKPFFKIYYTGAPLTDIKGQYEIIAQGSYYIDSWNIDEFGQTSIIALDGAKKLQQKFCPDILCKQFSSAAIIRRLLDSIGFTNYNINTDSVNEDSVITPKYWWTESSKTVWEALQEICKDNQIVAAFDENNILQFYTRKFLYAGSRDTNWPLTYDQQGLNLPNISSLEKKELRNGNNVIVKWNAIESTEASLQGAPLWTSPTSWMGAMALTENIPKTKTAGDYIALNPITTIPDISQDIFYSFTGYLLIDSEIIEYDAIQYQYSPVEKPLPNSWVYKDISSASDIKKYISEAFRPTYEYFKPSGRIRIKNRGLFNTEITQHIAGVDNNMSDWQVQTVRWA
jgi:hypothetical protein